MDSSLISSVLRKKYCPPEWAFFQEVGNGTGAKGSRYIDGLAVNLYPSTGHKTIGFEVKISTSDLLSELKDLSKSHAFHKYCHQWFLVVPESLCEKIDRYDIPKTWGVMAVRDDHSIKIKKRPDINETPEPIDKYFMAAILRRSCEFQNQLADIVRGESQWTINKAVEMEREVLQKKHKEWLAREIEASKAHYSKIIERVEEIEAQVGEVFLNSDLWKEDFAKNYMLAKRLNRLFTRDTAVNLSNLISTMDTASLQLADLRNGIEGLNKLT